MSRIVDVRLLSNYGNAMLLVANDPRIRVRDIALALGLSERAAQGIVADLIRGGFVSRRREGRNNVYEIKNDCFLHLPLEGEGDVRHFLDALAARKVTSAAERFEDLYGTSLIPTAIVSHDGVVQGANGALCELFGKGEDSLVGTHWHDVIVPEDRQFWVDTVQKIERGDEMRLLEQRFARPDGSTLWASFFITKMQGVNESTTSYIVHMPSVDDRRELEEQVNYFQLYDLLTGVANRTSLERRLEASLEVCRQGGTRSGVICLHVEHWKVLSASLGRDRVDELMRQVAERLIAITSPDDLVARFGDDEFVVVCDNVNRHELEVRVNAILASLRTTFVLLGHRMFVVTSAGAMVTDVSSSMHDVLRNVSAAALRADEKGGDRCVFVDDELIVGLKRSEKISIALHDALARGQFHVVYQPIVDLATGRLASLEALLRWNHPEFGPVGPDEFIPYVEQLGLIDEIGRWVLQRACRQLRSWSARDSTISVAVNVSVHQLVSESFVTMVEEVLRDSGVEGSKLILELTESVLMHDETVLSVTALRLKELGVQLAIDDFGTGFSSLGRLRGFLIGELKVDRSFVSQLGYDKHDTDLVEAIIGLARTLELTLVAEGIETMEQLTQLRTMGCAFGQGYYFARPMTVAQVDALLDANDPWNVGEALALAR